jgi:hypothetical protein
VWIGWIPHGDFTNKFILAQRRDEVLLFSNLSAKLIDILMVFQKKEAKSKLMMVKIQNK